MISRESLLPQYRKILLPACLKYVASLGVSVGYDLHIVRTLDWLKAWEAPITFAEVERAVQGDSELSFSDTDGFDTKSEDGVFRRNPAIVWKGGPFCWWDRDEIRCKNPLEPMIVKLIQMARALNAYVIGDDGERYEIRDGSSRKQQIVRIAPRLEL